MKQFLTNVWEKFIILTLFGLIFYAGIMTGIYYQNNITNINKEVDTMEQNIKELRIKIVVLEAITRKPK